jgi:hypothetical protein
MGFLKSYFLNVHVATILKKHLQSLKIIINGNVMFANPQKRHAKRIVNIPTSQNHMVI